MTLRDYLVLLRRGWLVVIVTTLVGLGSADVATVLATPTYSAGSSVVVTAAGSEGLTQGNDFSTARASTYAGLATTDAIVDKAAAATGDDVQRLRMAVSASARTGTSIIDVSATASDPRRAALRADAIADTLAGQAGAIDAPGSAGAVQLAVVSRAQVPRSPTSPRPRNNLAIGAIIGLALGIAAVVVFQSLDTRMRGATDLPRGQRFATVTSLPARRSRPGMFAAPADVRLESFRHLRANLQFGTSARKSIAVAGVTSASDAHGVANQLAAVLGEIGLSVVVVDLDLRTPLGARHRRKPSDAEPPGIADVLAGSARLHDVVRAGTVEGVSVVSSGAVKESSAQLLSTPPMHEALDQLSSQYDYVLFACPPVVERSEAAVVTALSGTSLLVVESGATRRAELLQALELLAGVGLTSVSLAIDHVRASEVGREVQPMSPPDAERRV